MSNIAENMYALMIERDIDYVWMGELHLIEECARRCNIKKDHPKKVIQSILNGIEKSDLFKKGYLMAEYNGRKRKFRCFSINKAI